MLDELGHTEFMHAQLKKHRFPTHFHDTFVIELVLAGEDWCSDSNQLASHGHVYVHFPGAPHTGGTHGAKPLVYRAIYPSVSLFCELTGVGEWEIPKGTSLISKDSRLVNLAHGLFQAFDDGRRRSQRRDLKHLFESILHLCSGLTPSETSVCEKNIDAKMRAARAFLSQNYFRDVSIVELCDQCDLSQFHLIRSFKKQFGITPRQFLISRRVAQARQLIVSGSSITAAAYQTGFADHSHLTRSFKRITNYCPRQLKLRGSQSRQIR